MYKEIEIELDDFDDDEVLEYVENCCENYSVFRDEIIKIAEKHISKDEIETTLDNLPKYPNQNYAKEIFEKMEFSKDLVKWILKTYGNQ